MIDFILDNMIVNRRKQHRLARQLRHKGLIEYTVCEEIAHEQRLALDQDRELIKREAETLERVVDFNCLANIANEMIDRKVLDLDEGGGDVMIAYECLANQTPSLFIQERIVVTDDGGLAGYCDDHDIKVIGEAEYMAIIQSFLVNNPA